MNIKWRLIESDSRYHRGEFWALGNLGDSIQICYGECQRKPLGIYFRFLNPVSMCKKEAFLYGHFVQNVSKEFENNGASSRVCIRIYE